MSNWQKTHWQLFNGLGRIVGTGFILGGGIFSVWGLLLVLDPKATFDVNGVPSNDPWIKATVLVIGLVVCVLGILLVIARPFRPDLQDSASQKQTDSQKEAGP